MGKNQNRAPIFEAVREYIRSGVVPFHVPAHKQGRGIEEFRRYVGDKVLAMDLTCVPGLDNILNPKGVIQEAEELAAEAFGADKAYFLVNGTTSGIQAMIMSVCGPREEIIVPRNAHRSAVGGLILSGARPVYVYPEVDRDFGISMAVTPESIEQAIFRHPRAKAVFVVNPTYYGVAADLERIVEIAHRNGLPVLVDEAHGAHLRFHPDLPPSSMEVGADLAAVSVHKLMGSMTQSSVLLLKGNLVDPQRVKSVLNIFQTTSPSYVLLSSLDVARKQAALRGRELVDRTLRLAWRVRKAIRGIPGLTLLDEEMVGMPGCWGLDITKVVVNVQRLGMSGLEMERLLRNRYGIQVELSDLYNVIFLISMGDTEESVDYLVRCLQEASWGRAIKNVVRYCPPLPELPEVAVSPREAFHSRTRKVSWETAVGEISAEMVMAYPPGIPLLCPGEIITREIVDYIRILREEGAELEGTEDALLNQVKVLDHAADAVEGETPGDSSDIIRAVSV